MRATITMPRNTPDLVEVALAALVAVAIASAIYRDLVVGGLGRSNGRIVSFLESLNSAAGFRRQKRATNADETRRKSVALQRLEWLHITSDQLAPLKKLELFLIVFFNKFGTQGLGSLLVGATPVILKGPRHVASWFLAFAAVQLSPGDAVHGALQRHVVLTLVVKTGAALYKLRKFNFVVDACAGCSGLLTLFAMLVTIDGNNLRSSGGEHVRFLQRPSRVRHQHANAAKVIGNGLRLSERGRRPQVQPRDDVGVAPGPRDDGRGRRARRRRLRRALRARRARGVFRAVLRLRGRVVRDVAVRHVQHAAPRARRVSLQERRRGALPANSPLSASGAGRRGG
mmetsp:Transcript_19358/g.59607  ORF Transcript_19358/g.59607 Transcript_19358/m.59607 type:complete len:342 (-) Transcript_19358:42-1067(-)